MVSYTYLTEKKVESKAPLLLCTEGAPCKEETQSLLLMKYKIVGILRNAKSMRASIIIPFHEYAMKKWYGSLDHKYTGIMNML